MSSSSSNNSSKSTKSSKRPEPTPTTPTSSSSSSLSTKISMSSSYLPYQYKRQVKIPSVVTTPLSSSTILSPTTHPRIIRLGMGSVAGNLKTSHIGNSKKDSLVPSIDKDKIFIRGSSKKSSSSRFNNTKNTFKTTPGGDLGNGITSRMKLLTIYESPKNNSNNSTNISSTPISSSTGGGNKGTSCRINPTDSVTGKVFLTLNKKANYLAALNRKASFCLGGVKGAFTINPKQKPNDEESNRAITHLCRHFRNILGWKLSIHLNWKYAEEKIKLWYSDSQQEPKKRLSIEEVGEILKIPGDKLRSFEFDLETEKIFNMLRKNLCHTACPIFAKLLTLQKLQQEIMPLHHSAGRFVSESCGMYLHSEIIDKHLTFIRRNEESKNEENCDPGHQLKSDIFWEQIHQTLNFSETCFGKFGEEEFKKCSSFNPDWNIVQISTSVNCSNRFGYDLVGKQTVPQLILSAFGFLPGESVTRNEFTTFCYEPLTEAGSPMRFGLIDAFEKLLDKNLTISDDKVIITRKKYWEERGKHNDAIEAIMNSMEDWLFPWTFLLTGTIKDVNIQQRISNEVLSHPTLRNCSDSQKFVIYRLTEGYNILPIRSRNFIDSLVAFILQVDEDVVLSLTKKIFYVGSCISSVEPRNPTILVLDQDIDILPWDWLPCLRTTDVSRMPSLNLINSTQHLTKLIGGEKKVVDTNKRSINKEKCTFVLNPDGSLPQVQTRLEKYFCDRVKWTPIIARSPTPQEMQNSLENQDVFLYCGHGNGSNFFPEYAVQKLVCKAIPILMGCSSAQSHFSGPGLYAYSSVHAYFTAGCTSVVGFLWEITDTECDRITADFIERWLPHSSAKLPKMPLFDSESMRDHEPELSSAWKKSRTAATQLLTQCSAVCYGIPIVKIN